jgi:hypothetical protein
MRLSPAVSNELRVYHNPRTFTAMEVKGNSSNSWNIDKKIKIAGDVLSCG